MEHATLITASATFESTLALTFSTFRYKKERKSSPSSFSVFNSRTGRALVDLFRSPLIVAYMSLVAFAVENRSDREIFCFRSDDVSILNTTIILELKVKLAFQMWQKH